MNVSNSCKFSVAEKNLSLKANRALFSIEQSIFDKSLAKPSAILHIFDFLVKPIALYGSEVWVSYKQCYKGKSVVDLLKMTLKYNSEFEKGHTRFCKYVLGVNSKACNFAVHSELGQFSLLITTLTNCLNLWLHIIQSGSDTLL